MSNHPSEVQAARYSDNPQSMRPPFLERVQVLWCHRWLLVKSAMSGLILAAGLAFLIPKRFESKVQLMPPDSQSSSLSNLAALASSSIPSALAGPASSLLGTKSSGAVFVGIMSSRTVQDDLINQFDLRRVYHTRRYVDARKTLTKRTSIDEDKKSGIISIVVTDNDPYRARDLAAAYVSELNRLISQMSTSSARRERMFLEERLKSVKKDLDDSTRDLSQFSSRNATMDVEAEGRTMLESAGKIQQELIASESELRGLEASYGPENTRVKAAKARITELRNGLQQLTGTGNETARPLESGQLYPSIRKLPMLGSTYSDFYRRVSIQEALYEALTKQYEMARVEEAKEIPTVKVLDPPDLAEKKSYPPRTLIAVAGMLLSLAFSMLWVLAASSWRRMSSGDPRKQMVLETLAIFTSADAHQKNLRHSAP